MPYGVTVEGDGSWYPKIVGAHPKKVNGSRLALVPGPCRVAFSWAGESAADLVLVNGDDVKRPARLAEKRGGGPRSAIVVIGARQGDQVEINAKGERGETGTIEVYPLDTLT